MNSKKTILIGVLALGIVAMTVAFAALSTNLRISGTASVPSTTWNIHFQNWALDTALTVTEGGITHQNTAEYPSIAQLSQTLSPNITKVDNLNVTLYQPGDYAKYTFQIINEGSIDASLDTFTHNLTCATGNDCSHLSYTIECKDSNENNVLTTHSTLPKNGGLAYCTLQVKYLDQTNQNSGNAQMNQTYTQAAAHATLDATWIYIQKVDSQAQSGGGSGSGSGSNTQSNPYWTTFDGNYTYMSHSSESEYVDFNNEWIVYLRKNLSTDVAEACRVFPSGTVCIAPSDQTYSDDFLDCGSEEIEDVACLKGYTKGKVDEMISKGASSCYVEWGSEVICNLSSGGKCQINSIGNVACYDDDGNNCNNDNYGDAGCY